jgi:hypothetical protein
MTARWQLVRRERQQYLLRQSRLPERYLGNAIASDGAPGRMNVKNGYVIVIPIKLR